MTYKGLGDRAVLAVEGIDAASFLQNLVTADVKKLESAGVAYSCLLSPQGQILNAFFLLFHEGRFLIDALKKDHDSLIKKLKMYALRSKVSFRGLPEIAVAVGNGSLPSGVLLHLQDPRLKELGQRAYGSFSAEEGGADYGDLCIAHGVAPDSAFKGGHDYMTDLNLDLLGAVSWDKGCFVGQEVAARMHHRGLVKKRLLIAEGENMAMGDRLVLDGVEMGEIRAVDQTGRKALALLKLSVLDQADCILQISEKPSVKPYKPLYLLGKN